MTVAASTPIELIQGVYATLDERLEVGRRRMGGPLTLAEKILVNHLDDPEDAALERGDGAGPRGASHGLRHRGLGCLEKFL